MHQRTRAIPVIVVLAVLGIAGCSSTNTTDTAVTTGSGIQVTDFATDRATLQSNADSFLHLTLQNIGARKATNVRAKLYGLTFGDCASCWEIRSNGPSCQLKSSQWVCLGELRAPQPNQNVEGETREGRWTLQAPAISSGSSQEAKFFARVHYTYESRATPQLTLVSRDEVEQEPAAGPLQIDTSSGPLAFSSRTNSPMVVSDNSDSRSFCLSAQNTGPGTVYSEQAGIGQPEGQEGRFQVSVSFEGLQIDKQRQMRVNGTTCFDFQPGSVDIRQRLPITITASYNYYFDVTHTATVNGA